MFTFSRHLLFTILALVLTKSTSAQYPPSFSREIISGSELSPLKKIYLTPQKIVWKSSDSLIICPENLLDKGSGQAFFENRKTCKIINKGEQPSGIILDFGREIHGGLQFTTSQSNNSIPKIRIRFGESVSECFGEAVNVPKGRDGSTNHHSLRDFEFILPGYGTIEVGNTGFRFARIDLIGADNSLVLQEIRAAFTYRDIPYLGSFKSNDERLNKIWETGAYTVHLCMQDYLVDGIKRDRMVWSGDMHPQLMTIASVFGYQEIIPRSLDFIRNNTPMPKYINGISSYSMWWVIMQYDWYELYGKLDYLKEQTDYLLPLLELLSKSVDKEGKEQFTTKERFLDWPSSRDPKATHAGMQALMAITFDKGSKLCQILNKRDLAGKYGKISEKMKRHVPDHNQSKQAASLLSLADMIDPEKANNDVITKDGAKRFSAFFGYYMLEAQAKAGDYNGALNNIRQFWGAMIDLGATTFWEEFDLDEALNAAPIDNVVPAGRKDYHRSTGDHCYVGLRRSLCHGWSAGPTPWLSRHVLGINIVEPGGLKIRLAPHLGNLEWVEGTFPTPAGQLYVKHVRLADGKIQTTFKAPEGVTILN